MMFWDYSGPPAAQPAPTGKPNGAAQQAPQQHKANGVPAKAARQQQGGQQPQPARAAKKGGERMQAAQQQGLQPIVEPFGASMSPEFEVGGPCLSRSTHLAVMQHAVDPASITLLAMAAAADARAMLKRTAPLLGTNKPAAVDMMCMSRKALWRDPSPHVDPETPFFQPPTPRRPGARSACAC